jgi:type I restriction enzyme S subunit
MSKEIKSKIVPRLRFLDFQNKGEWKETILGNVARFVNGRAYKQEELLDKGNYKVLRVGNFFTNNEWYYSDLELEDDKYCNEGDLLYAWSASFGPRIWKGEKTIYHYHIWKVINNEGIDKNFLFILLDYETDRMKSSSANGFALLHITKGTIENWECYIPESKNEQQKIASCLSSLDEYITAESQKLEALKTHKKGLMQQLFPAEGERVPKLRFPTFKDSGEWEEKSLGEVAEIKRGAASQHLKYITDNSSGIRLLRINDFLSNSPVYVENTEDMKRFTVKTNDLLIAGTGATAGIIFMVPEKFNNLAYSYNAPRIRIYKENSFFIYEYLKSDSILQQQQKFFVGNAQPFLDTKAIANLKVNVPTLAEQQKIASCLSSLDELITAQTEKIEALKEHKKGLMQGLFPSNL